jgi:hypothetical protein
MGGRLELLHVLDARNCLRGPPSFFAGTWEPTAFWIFKWLGVLLVSYTFFVLVEQPAQHLARNLGYRLSGTRPGGSGTRPG